MVTCTGHIGIHEGADGRTDVRMYVRTLYVRTDVHDVMAIKPNFLTSMDIDGLPYFLKYGAPRARNFGARGSPLKLFPAQKPFSEQQCKIYVVRG